MGLHFKGSRGYALPLVLLVIALVLLYTMTTTSRLRREAQINRLRENSEIANYAAEAGFNRARARIITRAKDAPAGDLVQALDQFTETIPGGGTYALTISPVPPTGTNLSAYRIDVTGTFGSGAFAATRFVRGTVEVTNSTIDGGYYRVVTTYER